MGQGQPVGEAIMRQFQIIVLGLGTAALIAAACFAGKELGDILWRAGMATLLFDVVCLQLWPGGRRGWDGSKHEGN